VAYGALRLPWIKDFPPAADRDCPRISLIFAARDEEEKLPAALATLTAIDYPILKSSQSMTARKITPRQSWMNLRWNTSAFALLTSIPFRRLAWENARLANGLRALDRRVATVHDADVRFAPDVVRRSVRLMNERGA